MKPDHKDADHSEVLPKLYAPAVVGTLGLLFTPAVGAFFSRENWRALGNAEEAARQGRWFYVGVALLVAMVVGAAADLGRLEGLAQLASLVQVILWFFQTQRRQIAYVKVRLGKNFETRSLLWPTLIASLVFGAALVWYTGRAMERANALIDQLGISVPAPGERP